MPAGTTHFPAFFLATAILSAHPVAGATAVAQTLDAAYQITLGGLSVGTASLRLSILAGDKYEMLLSARLTGLVGAVSGGNGAVTAGGGIGGELPLPTTFSLRSSNGRESRVIRMALNAGRVENIAIEPPLEKRPGDEQRVPLEAVHRRGVVDPVSALLMPVRTRLAGPPDTSACNRTIPVFDGAARYDIVMSYKSTQVLTAGQYSGPALVCAVRYRPVAGHRPDRKGTKFMAENRDIETWLAPVDGARVLVPVRIAVRTQVGMTTIQASKFDTSAGR